MERRRKRKAVCKERSARKGGKKEEIIERERKGEREEMSE